MIQVSEYIDYIFEKKASTFKEEPEHNILNNNGIEDTKNRTSIVKDRLFPLVKNQSGAMTAGALGSIIGAAGGYGAYTAARTIGKKVLNPKNLKKMGNMFGTEGGMVGEQIGQAMKGKKVVGKMKKPIKILFSDEYKRLRRLGAVGGGASAVGSKFYEAGKVIDRTQDYQKKHLKAFGTEPTEDEYLKASGLNPINSKHNLALRMFHTPEAMIKSKKRETSLQDRLEQNRILDSKKAQYVISCMEKRAKFSPTSLKNKGIELSRNAKTYLKNMSTSQKALSSLGGAIGGTSSMYATDKLTDDDSKLRKTKLLAGAGVGALAGAGMGNLIGKDISKITRGIAKKVDNPDIIISNATKFGKSVAKDIKTDYGPKAKAVYNHFEPKVKEAIKNKTKNAVNQAKEKINKASSVSKGVNINA